MPLSLIQNKLENVRRTKHLWRFCSINVPKYCVNIVQNIDSSLTHTQVRFIRILATDVQSVI